MALYFFIDVSSSLLNTVFTMPYMKYLLSIWPVKGWLCVWKWQQIFFCLILFSCQGQRSADLVHQWAWLSELLSEIKTPWNLEWLALFSNFTYWHDAPRKWTAAAINSKSTRSPCKPTIRPSMYFWNALFQKLSDLKYWTAVFKRVKLEELAELHVSPFIKSNKLPSAPSCHENSHRLRTRLLESQGSKCLYTSWE